MSKTKMVELTDEDLLAIRKTFQLYDKTGQNKIPIQQVGAVLYSMGHHQTETQLNEWIYKVETPNADHLTFDQFCMLMKLQKAQKEIEDEYREAFLIFDKDNDGFITAPELRSVMTYFGEKVTDEDIDDIIRAADLDKDGMIDYEEFVYLLESADTNF